MLVPRVSGLCSLQSHRCCWTWWSACSNALHPQKHGLQSTPKSPQSDIDKLSFWRSETSQAASHKRCKTPAPRKKLAQDSWHRALLPWCHMSHQSTCPFYKRRLTHHDPQLASCTLASSLHDQKEDCGLIPRHVLGPSPEIPSRQTQTLCSCHEGACNSYGRR